MLNISSYGRLISYCMGKIGISIWIAPKVKLGFILGVLLVTFVPFGHGHD